MVDGAIGGIGDREDEVDRNCSFVIHLWADGARRVDLKSVHLWVSSGALVVSGRLCRRKTLYMR